MKRAAVRISVTLVAALLSATSIFAAEPPPSTEGGPTVAAPASTPPPAASQTISVPRGESPATETQAPSASVPSAVPSPVAPAPPATTAPNESATSAVAPAPQAENPAFRKLTIDAGSLAGTLRSFQGVNGSPGPGTHKPEYFAFGGWGIPQNVDATAGYKRARIDLVRTHDSYGAGDIDARFGPGRIPGDAMISAEHDVFTLFPNPDADPENPASYNFAPTDKLITAIRNSGAEVMFRLGRSEASDVTPPADFDKYAAVVKHIVLHYNRGWANGFRYGIRYWEVWNEPDLGRLFWGGTPEQFFDLYGKIANAVREADPAALVGGPALARPNDASPYRDGFLEYVQKNKLPLDFFSWHWYATDSSDPQDFLRIARDVRARLDRFGFHQTRSVLNEWNYGLNPEPPPDMLRAAFIAASKVYMQDAPIDIATLYRADNLFGSDGTTPGKTGQALIALGTMKDTPLRLKVDGGDEDGFAVQAGRSSDGRTLQVLIANYQIPAQYLGRRKGEDVLRIPGSFEVTLLPRRDVAYRNNEGYDLTIGRLKPAARYQVDRYRVSADSDLTHIDSNIVPGAQVRLQAQLPPPSIELITVKEIEAPSVATETVLAPPPPAIQQLRASPGAS